MDCSRRHQAEGSGAKARWQGLGRNSQVGFRSIEIAVSGHRVTGRRRKTKTAGCSRKARQQGLGCSCRASSGSNEYPVLSRWCSALDPNFNGANRRWGKWTQDEVIKLKEAVQTYGGKDWVAIAALVPGRTNRQCCDRWTMCVDSNSSTGREEEHHTHNIAPTLGWIAPSPHVWPNFRTYDNHYAPILGWIAPSPHVWPNFRTYDYD
jgi:hypothetical protein